MSGFSAFTLWVRFKIPLTLRLAQGEPFDSAHGERDFESLNCRF